MLTLTNLQKRYREVIALDGLSLSAPRGRILGFLGPNGAGKTTSMRSVFGLVDLEAGKVEWEGNAITTQSRLRFGYMPEQRGLYRRMQVVRQLIFMGRLHGMEEDAATRAAQEWLERLGLGDRADSAVTDLSHGNQQRVQLAAALVHNPDLLVLDEPFSGLDPLGVAAMSEVLVQRAADGAAVVFSSHQLDLVEDLVDDVVIIASGRNRMEGSLHDVRASTGTSSVTFRLADGPAPAHVTLNGSDGPTDHDVRVTRDGLCHMRVPSTTEPTAIVETMGRLGTIERFSFEPPSLSQVFRQVVGMSLAEAEAEAAKDGDETTTAEVAR